MAGVRIAGGGLAGSAAAIAAARAGASVTFWDPSPLPRHKVCGEFLTPEIEPGLKQLGLWDQFLAARPARMDRMRLTFGSRTAESRFPEPAWGLSRYRLDAILRGEAARLGAEWIPARAPRDVDIVAHGRNGAAPGRNRLFGFKAHFLGPASDAVELFFFNGFYVGVNPAGSGVTNVCGLGPEAALRRQGFDYDALAASHGPLSERLRPMTRQTDWFTTGPLIYSSRLISPPVGPLLAGDALQFVDPFTGTGMSIALWTGSLAGAIAAHQHDPGEYYAALRRGLATQSRWCRWLRIAIEQRWPLHLAAAVPPAWLYALTRPKLLNR